VREKVDINIPNAAVLMFEDSAIGLIRKSFFYRYSFICLKILP